MTEIDDNGYQRLVYRGTIVNDGIKLQQVCPPIKEGFMRQSSKYIISADGSRLQYHVVDVEIVAKINGTIPPQRK